LAIRFYDEDITKQKIGRRVLKKWIKEEILRREKIPGELNIIFTSDTYLQELNKKHLSRDYYTDIISFDYSDELFVSGELFISIDRVRENASSYKVSFENELSRVIIHGILHLLGYNDGTDIEKNSMKAEEELSLRNLLKLLNH